MIKYVTIALVLLTLSGCDGVTGRAGDTKDNLPSGAYDVKYEGNLWFSFKWKGNCFLTNVNSTTLASNYDRAFTSYTCPKSEDL